GEDHVGVALRLGPVLGVDLRQPLRDLAIADGAGAVPPRALAVDPGDRSRRRGFLSTAWLSAAYFGIAGGGPRHRHRRGRRGGDRQVFQQSQDALQPVEGARRAEAALVNRESSIANKSSEAYRQLAFFQVSAPPLPWKMRTGCPNKLVEISRSRRIESWLGTS